MKKAVCVAGIALGVMLVFGGSAAIGALLAVGSLYAMDSWA